ncbi:MAG: ATP-binding protein [bacterium]
MDIQSKIQILKQIDLFDSFDEAVLRKLSENCQETFLKQDEILLEEGTIENVMFIILSGELIVYKGLKKIAVLGPGEYIGEMSLIESKPRSASAKAVGDVLLMKIDEFHFNKYLASERQALIAILRTLSNRIRKDLYVMTNDLQKLNIFIHDMNNCLTPMELIGFYLKNFIDDLKSNKDDQLKINDGAIEIEKALDLLNSVQNGLARLIQRSLSQYKKIEVDYIKTNSCIISLIHETINELQYHKDLKGKKIKVKSKGEIPEGYFNYLDIKRVLQNLLINAGYVTKDKGTIYIIAKRDNRNIKVSVMDKGCGIPEEIRPYLFKETVTTKEDGNGLGILSCKEIIETHHNGALWFDSVIGKGTAFHFTVPIAITISSQN